MYIKFKYLELRNINSYGNKLTTFNFENGINLISGKNGQGKSTILDGLCFCLFGTPYRKVKIDQLINRINKGKLWTRLVFNIDKEEYIITRTLKPNHFSITKNGDNLELLSSKKLNQDELNKILGIDLNLFRQVISLAVNYNKPYLSLTAKEKRDIIENIFNIKVFGDMMKVIKQRNSGLKGEYEINTKTLSILNKTIIDSQKQIKSLEKTKLNFDNTKEKEIDTLEKTIDKNKEHIEKHESNIKKGHNMLANRNNFKSTYNLKDKEDLNQEIGKIEYKIKKGQKDLKFFGDNNVCPVCDANLEGDNKLTHVHKIENRINESENKLKELNDKKDKINIDIDKSVENNAKINKIETAIQREKDKINFYNKHIENDIINKDNVKNRTFDFDMDDLKTSLVEREKEYNEGTENTTEIEKEIEINSIISKILGDDGIKTHFFSKLIPVLNKKINEYLELFGLPISLFFNDNMKEQITTLGSSEPVDYFSFSEGEKKRIDISILLSFIETTKMISNWGSNLIILDELLDGGTDEEGLDSIVNSIKDMTLRDDNLCIYLISHKPLDIEFNNVYHITKASGFSKIELVK